MGQTGKVSILLDKADVITIEAILLDEDGEEALKFVRNVINPKIKESAGEHCKAWE